MKQPVVQQINIQPSLGTREEYQADVPNHVGLPPQPSSPLETFAAVWLHGVESFRYPATN
jgi:hypothetical protein